jgi:hypothetical protein
MDSGGQKMLRYHLVPFHTQNLNQSEGGRVPISNSRADCAPKLARPLVGSFSSLTPERLPERGAFLNTRKAAGKAAAKVLDRVRRRGGKRIALDRVTGKAPLSRGVFLCIQGLHSSGSLPSLGRTAAMHPGEYSRHGSVNAAF